jgi:hypothetical protein
MKSKKRSASLLGLIALAARFLLNKATELLDQFIPVNQGAAFVVAHAALAVYPVGQLLHHPPHGISLQVLQRPGVVNVFTGIPVGQQGFDGAVVELVAIAGRYAS